MKKHLPTIIVVVIFLCGLSLFLYPTISNLYNQYLNDQLIGDYKDSLAAIAPEKIDQAMTNALAFNQNRYNPDKLKELGLTYENTLNATNNGVMGYVEIPKISVSLIIYHTIDEEVLQKGIGHVPESHLPVGGENTHCVLAGHTGLPSAKLLTNIDHLQIGDRFYIHVLNEVLEYKIDDISVVEPDEVSKLNVISGKDCVTLVTCTPYGVNSHRLLVRGARVDGADLSAREDAIDNELLDIDIKLLLTFSLIGLFIIFLAVRKLLKIKKRKREKTKPESNPTAISESEHSHEEDS
ncbi:MAG: class C sortase [Clostridia bacterium]|nr:class C sortase [Clostridia bacterium]